MTQFRRLGLALALAGMPMAVCAQSGAQCIPKTQVRDATIVAFPYFIDSARTTCAPQLPETAFLRTDKGLEFAARLKGERTAREHSAAGAFRAMASAAEYLDSSDAELIDSVGPAVARRVLGKLNGRSCADLSDAIQAVSTLPPEQVGVLVTAIFALAGVDKPGICAP